MINQQHNKIINFGAGPAALPASVLQETAKAVLNYNGSGLSILEIPHRGKLFDDILDEAKQLVKELAGIGDDYEVLWLQGGGRMQFCMIPMNFLASNEAAGFVDSGFWAADAITHAAYYGQTKVLSSTKEINYNKLPEWPIAVDPALAYLHYTTNNTIYGTQRRELPTGNVPLIADMSSDIFSGKRIYTNCDMFYAVAQKNIGAAGVTLAVIKKDLLQKIRRALPPMLDYSAHAKRNSVLNTPPVFSIYNALLMLRWIKERTIEVIEHENIEKAALLYSEIERNALFIANITEQADRSRMNACFDLRESNKDTKAAFLNVCEQNSITGIDGHRSVPGFRVSMYNAISLADVAKLVSVMQEFEHNYQP